MRLIANENISGQLIRELRARAHDVVSVKEEMRSGEDDEILKRAGREKRVVLTHDKDFGELAARGGLPSACGVILLRLSGKEPGHDTRRALLALRSRSICLLTLTRPVSTSVTFTVS